MEPSGPPAFVALPQRTRESIVAELRQTTQFAYDHAVPIIISLPPKANAPESLRSATAFLVQPNEQIYLGTADHVWRSYLRRKADGESVVCQVGTLLLDEARAAPIRDITYDLAFFPISRAEAAKVGATLSTAVAGWPPPVPSVGSFVSFAGCPEYRRNHDSQSHVGFGTFGSIMEVTAVAEHHIVCQFQRDMWVTYGPELPPSPGDDLSGMSGGPAFSLASPLSMPMIGLISEFSSNLELLYINHFAHVQLA